MFSVCGQNKTNTPPCVCQELRWRSPRWACTQQPLQPNWRGRTSCCVRPQTCLLLWSSSPGADAGRTVPGRSSRFLKESSWSSESREASWRYRRSSRMLSTRISTSATSSTSGAQWRPEQSKVTKPPPFVQQGSGFMTLTGFSVVPEVSAVPMPVEGSSDQQAEWHRERQLCMMYLLLIVKALLYCCSLPLLRDRRPSTASAQVNWLPAASSNTRTPGWNYPETEPFRIKHVCVTGHIQFI